MSLDQNVTKSYFDSVNLASGTDVGRGTGRI